jgi:predicted unusual protein kinase regulating ubiquinone biosynthesis (AarF/ABC1/UbiB family)
VNEDIDPSNILVRKRKDGRPEVVLLDHGEYYSVEEELRIKFCQLYYLMTIQ